MVARYNLPYTEDICSSCIEGKITRNKFFEFKTKTNKIGEIKHTGIADCNTIIRELQIFTGINWWLFFSCSKIVKIKKWGWEKCHWFYLTHKNSTEAEN